MLLILHQSDPIPASEERDSDHLLSTETVNNSKYLIWCHHWSLEAFKLTGNRAECRKTLVTLTIQHEAGYMESDSCTCLRGMTTSQHREVKEKHDSQYLVQTCIREQWKYMVNSRRLWASMRERKHLAEASRKKECNLTAKSWEMLILQYQL